MKKIIFTFALLVQTALAFASKGDLILAQARQDNVKMHLQPGTSTPIVKSLSTNDRIEVIRRFNDLWTIVLVDGQAGYVLHSEIRKPELKTYAMAKTTRRK